MTSHATDSRFQNHAAFARTADHFVLSVLSKRTYAWNAAGAVGAASTQRPMALDISHERRSDRNGEVVVQGRDVWPLKAATDVVVTGHAHAPRGDAVTQLPVEVSVGQRSRRVIAFGPRFVERRAHGRLAFSPPIAVQSVELSWWNAYGGIDPMVLPEGLHDTPIFAGRPVLELFPGAYPRNPSGTGYMINDTKELLDGLTLPQLEDPTQLLTPNDLLVHEPASWWRRPLPAAFGWCHSLWFPRVLRCGGKPYHLPNSVPPGELRERELGRVTDADLAVGAPRAPDLRMTNEAAPDMIMPYLRGDETIRLTGMSAHGEQLFRLPAMQPNVSVWIDGETLPVLTSAIHTLAIDAEAREFYLVHSTRFVVPNELAADLSVEVPLDDAVARCRVEIDGHPLDRNQWSDAAERNE
jgi:hypothetical protein